MSISVSKARTDLYNLIDRVSESHVPVFITGKRHNAVLVSEEDWRSIQETLHIMSVPGLYESIKRGAEEPLSECSRDLSW